MVKLLMSAGIALLILASVVEVVVDLRDVDSPHFLPDVLAAQPPSEPATALGAAGMGALVIGLLAEMLVLSNPLPGGRVLVGLIACLGFLLVGGYLVD